MHQMQYAKGEPYSGSCRHEADSETEAAEVARFRAFIFYGWSPRELEALYRRRLLEC